MPCTFNLTRPGLPVSPSVVCESDAATLRISGDEWKVWNAGSWRAVTENVGVLQAFEPSTPATLGSLCLSIARAIARESSLQFQKEYADSREPEPVKGVR